MPSRWGPPIDVRPLLASEQDASLSYLQDLTGDQWEVVTAAAPWRVRDVVAHLVGDDLGRLARSRDSHQPAGPGPGEPLGSFLHRFNAQWVEATARLSPRVLLELLADAGPRVLELWHSMDLDAVGERVSWAGPEPAPVWLDAARDYTESWVHQQQIREATGGDLLTLPHLFGPVVDTFARALPQTLRHVAGAFAGATVSLVVSGRSGGTWSVHSDGEQWLFTECAGHSEAMTVRIDEDSFWRLCTRSLLPEQARAAVTGEAEPAVVAAVREMTAIIV